MPLLTQNTFLLSASIEAVYDITFVGDMFLKDAFNEINRQKNVSAMDRKKNMVPLYMLEYYNAFGFYNGAGVKTAVGRIVNSLIKALNARERLPRYLVVVLDKENH